MKRASGGWRRAVPTLVTAGLVALCVAATPRFVLPVGAGAAVPDTRVRSAGREASAQSIPDTLDYQIGAKGAVVIDAKSGRVLFAQNANGRLAMASTTKIMTAMLTLEQENLSEYFTADSGAIHVEGSSMGLREGDEVSLDALAHGMLLPSGNDAANAAAVKIAGSLPGFARLMNERAAELGLEDTSFVTPSGLDDERHFSSAYDMALLAREAMENPRFAEICALPKAKIQFGNPPYDRWLSNHNRLLRECEGVIGVKTGFTDSAGRCLVSCAERGGIRLIVVTLGCPDDWSAHSKLYDRYFSLLQPTDITATFPEINIPVTGGVAPSVTAVCDPEQLALLGGEEPEIIITAPPFLYAPVREGQVVGRIYIRSAGQPLSELTLTAARTVEGRAGRGGR